MAACGCLEGQRPPAEGTTVHGRDATGGRPGIERQGYLPRKPVWCLTTQLPLRDAAGKVIGLVGISRDVRAPVDPRNIPVELAAALESLEKNLAESVTPASLARRAGLTPPPGLPGSSIVSSISLPASP